MRSLAMLSLVTALLLSPSSTEGLVPLSNVAGFPPHSPVTSTACFTTTRTRTSTPTRLYGGYDATIGADPNTPIQIYCSAEKTPDDLSTFLCLTELGLQYEVMSELPNPIPDWFLRIHPDGTTPALRNPVDESLNNDIVANTLDDTDKVNQYLCQVYQANNKADDSATSCPLLPPDEKAMQSIQSQIHKTILPACKSFLDNEDPNQEASCQATAENALRSLFQSAGTPFLMGRDMTLVDIELFTHLKSIFLDLNEKKKYILPSSTMGNMKSWHDACESRPAFQEVLSAKE